MTYTLKVGQMAREDDLTHKERLDLRLAAMAADAEKRAAAFPPAPAPKARAVKVK